MEPRIQYAKTKDGVSIAYSVAGEGPVLVQMPVIPWGHVQLEWELEPWASVSRQLAATRTLIRYDGRGSGLSERGVLDRSLDAHLLDLEAVVRELDQEVFALFAVTHAGPVAVSYATSQPERITHLILRDSYAKASDYFESPQAQGGTRST